MEPDHSHRKRVRHYEGQRHLHELTFSTYQRLPLLGSDLANSILARELTAASEAESFGLVAFVFMPEHVHLLVLPLSPTARISRLLGRTKRQTSVEMKQQMLGRNSRFLPKLMVRERPRKTTFRFWQEGPGFDRNLFHPAAVAASIDYIHANPVHRGLCKQATDWKWSSAGFYETGIRAPQLPPLTRSDPEWFHATGVQMHPG